MSFPQDISQAKGDDFLAEFLAGPCPMSYDHASACSVESRKPVYGIDSVPSEATVNQNSLNGQIDSVTSDIIGSAVALSGIIPVEDQFDQVKRNLTDHFLESPIGDENPSCENDSDDVLSTKEVFDQVSAKEQDTSCVSVEPELVDGPRKSKNAQCKQKARAIEKEALDDLRFIFTEREFFCNFRSCI